LPKGGRIRGFPICCHKEQTGGATQKARIGEERESNVKLSCPSEGENPGGVKLSGSLRGGGGIAKKEDRERKDKSTWKIEIEKPSSISIGQEIARKIQIESRRKLKFLPAHLLSGLETKEK